MKTLAIILALLMTFADSPAQGWDSSFRNSYYEQKVSQFRLLPDAPDEIIFLGNSITDIGEWTELWGDLRVKNRGISSDITFGVLARLDEVLSSQPAKIFLLIGINDIARNIPDSVILNNYRRIVGRVRRESPRTQLFVQSILPTNHHFTEYRNHQNKLDHVRFINGELQKLCREQAITYVDLHTPLADAEGNLDRGYTNDGLHLTGAGYARWRDLLRELGHM